MPGASNRFDSSRSAAAALRRYAQRRWPWLMAAALLGLSLPVWLPAVPRYRGAWARLAWLPDLAVHWQWAYGALWALAWLIGAALVWTRSASDAVRRKWLTLAACALVGVALTWITLGRVHRVAHD